MKTTTTQARPFPRNLVADRGRLVDSAGNYHGRVIDATVLFYSELIERSNAHDDLVAALSNLLERINRDGTLHLTQEAIAARVVLEGLS